MNFFRWTKFFPLLKHGPLKSRWNRFIFISLPLFVLTIALTVSSSNRLLLNGTSQVPLFNLAGLNPLAVKKFSPILSSFDISLTPLCRQGNSVGYQAATAIGDPLQVSDRSIRNANSGGSLEPLAPGWKDKLSAPPFPQIHGRARLAKVPVIMYHDIIAEKQVFFDVTPEEFESALQLIQKNGLTPISLDQLVEHLKTGIPLPKKPIVLTFDDGYQGHYKFVYPLLKKYGYPAAFAIYPAKVGTTKGRSSVTWEQLREMAADPLVTIASHSVTHPLDLRALSDEQLKQELVESKNTLEKELSLPIKYFIYPSGKNDDRVQQGIQQARYEAAWTMNDEETRFAEDSESLLTIDRIGQSQLAEVIEKAEGGPPLTFLGNALNFYAPVELTRKTSSNVPLIFASGGKPITIHADSRYQVPKIVAGTTAIAAVDGGFFSLESEDSNIMIGPVFSQKTGRFVPGNPKELPLLKNRPLVLINPTTVKFVPFDPVRHNTQAELESELPGLTDAFVAAGWLVKDGQPQNAQSFGKLYGFDAERDRAFWGVDWADRPVVGVSGDYVNSVKFGEALSRAGLRDAIMLDSGASASLAYQGESMMSYTPRPVPHVVALLPPEPVETSACKVTTSQKSQGQKASGIQGDEPAKS
jgi:peptidoglycan/xylan/chitin deacetylase (PgdA/CDA1 family)